MLRPENERLLGHGIGRVQFIETCAVLGILFGVMRDATVDRAFNDRFRSRLLVPLLLYRSGDAPAPADGGADSIHTIDRESPSKAALHQYRGILRPMLRGDLKKSRLKYTHWPSRESRSQEPQPQREEI